MLGNVKGHCRNKPTLKIISIFFGWRSFAVRTFYDDICDEGNTLIDLEKALVWIIKRAPREIRRKR
jgi:hypothetical protein